MQKITAAFEDTFDRIPGLVWSIPLVVYMLHALLYANWVVDDAAISYVYARNLAEGYGLVSQPGRVPVEAYSNFLWVFLLSPFFKLGIFHPYVIPKLLSGGLMGGTFFLIRKTLARHSDLPDTGVFVILNLLSVNASFVLWSMCGLENPLYIFLVTWLWVETVRYLSQDKARIRDAIRIGVMSGAIALTRPEGVLYVGIFPVCLILLRMLGRSAKRKDLLEAGIAALCGGLIVGGYLGFRLMYFHDLFPDPYYVKGGPNIWSLFSLVKMHNLMRSIAGPLGLPVLLGMLGLFIWLARTGLQKRLHIITAAFFLWAMAVFLLLPYDWLGWYRYASPFFVSVYVLGAILVFPLWKRSNGSSRMYRNIAWGILGAFLAGSMAMGGIIAQKRRTSPIVPFQEVAEKYGQRFNRYAEKLNLEKGSLLLPDLGGTLYFSDLTVYDMAGLSDKTIANSFVRDHQTFYSYMFDEIRPTFIHVHGFWSVEANLYADPRFERDYIPIYQVEEPLGKRTGTTIFTGDYVRREAIDEESKAWNEIQQDARSWYP